MRTAPERIAGARAKLAGETDVWVATGDGTGVAHLVPLSLCWHDGEVVVATEARSRTARNAAASGQAHLALDSTRDVVSIEATVIVVARADAEPALVDAYRARTGWDPGSRLALVCSVGNNPTMASWSEIEKKSPEFALRVRARFEAGTNKTLASLRRDGAPRISASELEFSSDGEVTLGMMPGSRKLRDVRRDPRVALHSPTLEPPKGDPNSGPGDAKLSGRLLEVSPPEDTPNQGASYFKLDITEVTLTYVGTPADHLVIESWHPTRGWERRTRT